MQIRNLSDENSLLNQFIKEIRDVTIQKDSMRFRCNVERIGEIMAYEISKTFPYQCETVTTPLGTTELNTFNTQVVIASILRAGLPFHNGMLHYLDNAGNAFVSAFRRYTDDNHEKFDVHVEYIASPDLTDKTLLLCDPMLATGGSMELAYKALMSKGKPKRIHIASVIASQPAIDFLQNYFQDTDTIIWTAAIDPKLNEHAYIVPGLGDAGDLAFGEKI
ncbi:MAG: uracil phosphoribosyltransferase [Sphingobacteriia bacterium]|jgi:uracil phosphoribosyltransferase|nr:uracil phosphoribosyltransferase [Sphingobacteriia bacterium]